MKLKQIQWCPICEKTESINGETCHKCKRKFSLDGLLVCADYEENKSIKKAVHLYKYRFVADLHIPLGKIMVQKITSSSMKLPDIIIPIPLHSKRLRWRGFNQAELLAHYISKNIAPGLEIPCMPRAILRKLHTTPQMNIKSYHKRKKNLENAFDASQEKKSLKGKNILLVDDIATTGTTLFECAKTLKENGASKVFSIVIARPRMNPTHKERR